MRWVLWAEHCYNSSWHSTTKTTPFEAVYMRAPPNLLSYIPRIDKSTEVDETLHIRDQIVELLCTNLAATQNQMK